MRYFTDDARTSESALGVRVRVEAERRRLARPSDEELHAAQKYRHGFKLDREAEACVVERFGELVKGPHSWQRRVDLCILIANLMRRRRPRPVRIPFDRNQWPSPRRSRYRRASFSTVRLIKKLEDKGMVEIAPGYNYPSGKPRQTRVWATKALYDVLFDMQPHIHFEPTELVELRKRDSRELKNYSDTSKTRRIRRALLSYNTLLASTDVRYHHRSLKVGIKAVFTETFNQHGRLYTFGSRYHVQGYSSNDRQEMTINGKPVGELDYCGLHPRLLYAARGEQYPEEEDPYDAIIPGASRPCRTFLKEALLSILNARPRRITSRAGKRIRPYLRSASDNAAAGIGLRMKGLRPDGEGGVEPIAGLDRQELPRELAAAGLHRGADVIEAFEQAHSTIVDFFCADAGMRLMNMDAQIALDVIGHFVEQQIPVIPIHDSFILARPHIDELHQVMRETFRRHTNGFSCPVKGS